MRIVYGHESFSARAGLYWVSKVGMTITPEERVQFIPIYRNNQNVEAGVFTFWGTTFLLYLEEEGPPKPFAGLYIDSDYIGDAEFAYRGKGMTYSLGPFRSHKIVFDWP